MSGHTINGPLLAMIKEILVDIRLRILEETFVTPRNIGYVMKLEGTERVILRGNEDNFIYATNAGGAQSHRNLSNAPAIIQHTTGGWWNFHSISYAGGTFQMMAQKAQIKEIMCNGL